jgi:NADH:ubiquinone oxidoreductase subunit C
MQPSDLIDFSGISGTQDWRPDKDAWWMDAPALDIVAMANLCQQNGARLVTLSGLAAGSETEVIYHYFWQGHALNLRVRSRDQSLPSIAALTPAAEWIEREIHDLYAVNFVGHPALTPLIRPPELAPGFFRLPGGRENSHIQS